MWKLVFNVANVIWKFFFKKTHKVHMNNDMCKAFKKCVFGTKIWKIKKIATHINLWKYDQILIIQKSLTIKWLRFSKKIFFIWICHIVLDYILNLNNNFGMGINIIFFILWCFSSMTNPFFLFQKFITTNKWNFYQ
jgi:hypothetical protein